MNATRRQNLKAMGGRETSLTDFLGLKAGEEALIDLQIDLGENVKARRLSKGWTQSELARALDTTQPYVARLEQGAASTDLLLRALFVLGASHQEIASVVAAAGADETPIYKAAPQRQTTKPQRTKTRSQVLANAS